MPKRASARGKRTKNKAVPLYRRPARSSRGPQRCADVAHFGVEVLLFGAERLKKRRRCFRHALVSPVATTLQLCSVSCLSGRPLFSSAFNSVAHFPTHLESTLLCGSNVDGSSWFPITLRSRGPPTRPVLARWGVGHGVPRRARCWRGGVWVTAIKKGGSCCREATSTRF